jgi:polyisoprenoid-binding protein YceI
MTPQLKHLFAVAVLSLGTPLIAQSTAWQIDPAHSTVLFTVRHLGVSNVHGSFTNITGTANIDDKDITKSSVEAAIDTPTVNTDNPDRDKDLKSPHFFDVAKYPTATFKSKQIINSGGQIAGDRHLNPAWRQQRRHSRPGATVKSSHRHGQTAPRVHRIDDTQPPRLRSGLGR